MGAIPISLGNDPDIALVKEANDLGARLITEDRKDDAVLVLKMAKRLAVVRGKLDGLEAVTRVLKDRLRTSGVDDDA